MKLAVPICFGLGALMLVLSFLWPIMFPAKEVLTEDKTARALELQTRGHNLVSQIAKAEANPNMQGGKSAGELKEELKELKGELDAIRNDFESAESTQSTMVSIFKYGGILVLAVGVGIHFTTNG